MVMRGKIKMDIYINYTNELCHHGVKGQHWGVRRYQFADGSLTPEGREHLGYDHPEYSRNIKSKIKELSEKSGAIGKTAKSYITGKNLVDSYLKEGTTFSRVQSYKNFESDHAFYATYKKSDVDKYQGLFGKNLKDRAKYRDDLTDTEKENLKIYKLDIAAQKKLKIPSDENAAHVTSQLIKDADFKENLRTSIIDSKAIMRRPQQQVVFNDALSALEKDNLSSTDKTNLYKALNITLTNHNDSQIAMQNRFYEEMKKKGYSAIIDVNDKEYSSYHAKRPVIIFDMDKVKLQAVTELDDKRVSKLYKRYNSERLIKEGFHQVTSGLPTIGKMSMQEAKRYNRRKRDAYLGE